MHRDPMTERDACGVGFVADVCGRADHQILSLALTAVASMRHRGAVAADGKTGDGAGVLTQIPYRLLRREMSLPASDADIALGMLFFPQDAGRVTQARQIIEEVIQQTGIGLVGWRDVPVDPDALGAYARATRPHIAQVVMARPAGLDDAAFDRLLYRCRRAIEREAASAALEVYIPSFSRRTVVYKGLFASPQLPRFYRDLVDPAYETALAVFHQRYSTNTFPSWRLAQPFRAIAHNGEINTLQGNIAWTRAREARFPPEFVPLLQEGGSDSAMLDNVVELLTVCGRDLAHVLLMLVPPAWEGEAEMDEEVRAFFAYHACLTEPWDGPAALAFSDGTVVGAALDRNGFRPARFCRTADGLVIMASEAGVIDLPPERIVELGRLGPGQMLLVDTARGTVRRDGEVKRDYAARRPYGEWVRRHLVSLPGDLPVGHPPAGASLTLQRVFGYTVEDVAHILRAMAEEGKDPVFSMGDDTPPAVLSQRPRLLYAYFRQRFAQVTNPPIDPLRERLVMSLASHLGPAPPLLEPGPAGEEAIVRLPSPILTPAQVRWLVEEGPLPVHRLSALVDVAAGPAALQDAVEAVAAEACRVARQPGILVVSDAGVDAGHAPIPMLLAVAAVHHALIRSGRRLRVGLIAETGEARTIHHLACLLGYGANAVVPWLVETALTAGSANGDREQRWQAYRRAAEAGLLKIMSKMGISTLAGYCGAQIFEAIGLDGDLIARYFPGTPSRIGGIGLETIASELLARHREAFASGDGRDGDRPPEDGLPETGEIRFRRGGEFHAFNPYVVKALHRAARHGDDAARQAFAALVTDRPPAALRDLLEFAPQAPVPLTEVEPAEQIVRRFVISAMSHGALSLEAHRALAVAANRLGARSNSGEGGEDPSRYPRPSNGEGWANSRIKQIASARFGVTPAYILSADELEIKMAQGSKPGEGGQLPGHKVSREIAAIRRAQPGITLISPPPHHDIYSIEDLAQLIYDLKRIHPAARVAVKLVAESGVGTIAAGVAKAFADTIQISGHDGGTGASPLDSIKHAGVPWELGLAETQQVLVANDLRGRVRLRVDGGLKTGRDVVIAALLGADEFGFGTAAVVALGCVMARQCHLNTCPVGIATQREDLRAKFTGRPERVMAYLLGVAQEVREILASLGARTLDEIIGRVELLRPRPTSHPKAAGLDLGFVLRDPDPGRVRPRRAVRSRNDPPAGGDDLEEQILEEIVPLLDGRRAATEGAVRRRYRIRNAHRTVGAGVAGVIARRYGDAGLPEGAIVLEFEGAAGQSFGAFCVPGLALHLTGQANDYVGKGMAGGEIVIRPAPGWAGATQDNVILGNTVLYGATGGRLFAAGRAGERFAVRNSGATAVVEGVGDHGCEYMTGGTVVILGDVGRNFAAGMTGGVAYVFDESDVLRLRCNPEHVRVEPLTDPAEAAAVADLIAAHHRLTGSARARAILERWPHSAGNFRRVAPAVPVPVPPAPAPASVVR
ncbi:MAG: glutamate synthase large subunit [Armatimonadota bacterium]|nr:glutamate synthase large subunit [Armatimonadota bacterium]MDR7451498.1 glutamate synthase large subunit [Armatimonadota bacterium]MDR7467465.1 glutamate synthase large subunit [Armatimonadota bacterium]MDR7494339.1 glutamate synthase large subunit [Armatimonadota bacterium]MDR7499156.1 glutamate synthase large subunit [Armatimonadota bacterium]